MARSQKQIMIIEDEQDTAEMLAEMMRLSGYQVRKSHGSKMAMALMVQEKPDAVILDVMLPDISGLEVLHFMRRDPSLSYIPVIVVSAKSMPSDVQQGIKAGASVYLTKPVAFQDLIHAVTHVFEQIPDEQVSN